MTLIEWFFALALLANTVLLSVFFVTVRDALRTLIARRGRKGTHDE